MSLLATRTGKDTGWNKKPRHYTQCRGTAATSGPTGTRGSINVNETQTPRLDYRRAQFISSAPDLAHCPPDEGREVAFAGRSNAGKSSTINALTGQTKLARTSKTPGRTQLLNFFALDEGLRLVDLPGYGFAKVPLAVKQAWQRNMEGYLQYRQSLCGMVLLMDVRHPLQAADQQLLAWSLAASLPVHLVLTKADKLKRGAAANARLAVEKAVTGRGEVSVQLFSSLNKSGVEELAQRLDTWLLGEDATP